MPVHRPADPEAVAAGMIDDPQRIRWRLIQHPPHPAQEQASVVYRRPSVVPVRPPRPPVIERPRNEWWSIPRGEWRGEAAVILGGGPSLRRDLVPALRGRARVIAVNNAYLLAPWADMLYFADRRWWEWNKHDLGRYEGPHMVTRQRVEDPRVKRLGRERVEALSRNPCVVAGWCGGANAINIAYLYGANPIILMGFDMRPGNWHDLHKLPHAPNQHRDRFIPALERMAVELERENVTVLNTNPRSALRCFPFADIEELLAMDDLAKVEREKYLAIWQHPGYRRISPGMYEVERAWAVMGMKPGDSIIDFGSGTGRATAWFRGQGLEVLAIDHVPTALETDVPFVEACLWDLPDTIKPADYGFCCDVLEHIPQEKISDVLSAIRRLTKKAAYLRIATRPDRMGQLIGQPLHLSVYSGDWWRRQVEAHWDLVDVIEDTGRDVILLARP